MCFLKKSLLTLGLIIASQTIYSQELPASTQQEVSQLNALSEKMLPPVTPANAPQSLAEKWDVIIKELSSKKEMISEYIDSQTGPKASLASKIKAIINGIELQREYLVDLILGRTSAKDTDKQLNAIIKNLETQQNALSNLIQPQENASAPKVQKNKSFQVFVSP